jgi:hypothetical protein
MTGGAVVSVYDTDAGNAGASAANLLEFGNKVIQPNVSILPPLFVFPDLGNESQHFSQVVSNFHKWKQISAPPAFSAQTAALWFDDGAAAEADNPMDLLLSARDSTDPARKTVKLWDYETGALVADSNLRVENGYISIRDGSQVIKGLIGLTAGNEPFFTNTNDGTTFDPNDGAILLGVGKATLYGTQIQLPGSADVLLGLRDLQIDGAGNLVTADLPTPGWSDTDLSVTPDVDLGSGAGVGAWTSLNCTITIPQTVTAGDRLDLYMTAQVANKVGNQTGSVEYGVGIDAGAPTGVRYSHGISAGFQGQVGSTAQWSTHGGLAAAQTLTLYARINNGSAASFGLDVLATVQASQLTVSTPAAAAAQAQATANAASISVLETLLDGLITYGSISFADNAVATTVAASSDDWSNAVILDRFDTNGLLQESTPDQANNRIEIDRNGRYELVFTGTFQNGNLDTIEASFYVNGIRVGVPQAAACSGANKEENLSLRIPTIDLVDGDLVDIRFQNHDTSTNVTWDHGVASVRMVDIP